MVNIPIFFDFVHPDNEIIIVKEKRPIIKVDIPISLGIKKSLATTSFKIPPGVVAIEICIMANTVTRKQPADRVADIKIIFVSLSFLSETNKLATTAIENPLSKELIRIVWFANVFQYSNVISIFYSRFFLMFANVFVYDFVACLSTKVANKSQIESPRGLS